MPTGGSSSTSDAEGFMLDGVTPGSIVAFPTSIELVELVGQIQIGVEERSEEVF